MKLKIENIKHIHFTGIKGVGLTALACCAQDLKIKISGSDTKEKFVTDSILKKRKIDWTIGFDPKNVPSKTAHQGSKNPQVLHAKKSKIPTLNYAQALRLFMEPKISISLCGVGGKTTTAAMLAQILTQANLNPSYLVGCGSIDPLGSPGAYQQNSKYFIAEADEYFADPGKDDQPKFLYQSPQIIGVSNIEYDHPDVFKSFADTQKAFLEFFNKLPANGNLVAFADNKDTMFLSRASKKNLITYGSHPQADFQVTSYHVADQKAIFTLKYQDMSQEYCLQVPGKFNAFNASAAIAIATQLGISQPICQKALKQFKGTSRRFQLLAQTNDITVVDDYAHTPHEIQATLEAAKQWLPGKRIVAIFQPHTFSRTKSLLPEFAQSFNHADQAIILPIYASAREAKDPQVNSQLLTEKIKNYNSQVQYIASDDQLLNYLSANIKPFDIVLFMGAGDIFLKAQKYAKNLQSLK